MTVALTANSPSAGFIAWSAFTVNYLGVDYPVTAGNSNKHYVAWLYLGGVPQIVTSDSVPIEGATNGTTASWGTTSPVLGPDDLLLFINRVGVPINAQQSQIVGGDLIASGTITSANIATGNITSDRLYSGVVQANLIQGANIAADTITATQIGANAITADEIQSNVITTEKLTIGTIGANLVKNPNFEDANAAGTGPANWSQGQVGGVPTLVWAAKINGSKSVGIGPNTSTIGGSWQSTPFPVTPGSTLAVNGLLQATAATGGAAYVRMYYGTASTMTFSTNLIAGTPAIPTKVSTTDLTTGTVISQTGTATVAQATLVNNWTPTSTNIWRFQGQSLVPAGATWAIVTVYNWSNATGGCTIYYDDVAVNSVLVTAQLGDGVITANQIAANTINTTQLNANAINGMTITSNNINSATITGGTITGALVATASSPNQRWEMGTASRDDSLVGFTGDGFESAAGSIQTQIVTHVLSTPRNIAGQTIVISPTFSGNIGGGSTVSPAASVAAFSATQPNGPTNQGWAYVKLTAGAQTLLFDAFGSITASQMRPVQSNVATQETTASTTYVALTTADTVNVVVPASGIIKVTFSVQMANSAVSGQSFVTPVVTDGAATPLAASDNNAAFFTAAVAGQIVVIGRSILVSGLTVGNTVTVKLQYRVTANTGTFVRRFLIAEPSV